MAPKTGRKASGSLTRGKASGSLTRGRASGNDDIRALTKVSGGASYAITLPRAVVKSFRWKERQKLKLMIDTKKKTITIRNWKK